MAQVGSSRGSAGEGGPPTGPAPAPVRAGGADRPSVPPSRLILASASPRRRELLGRIGIDPVVVPAAVDETPRSGEGAVAYVARLARAKALAGVAAGTDVVLGADTTVDLDGAILGKPGDAAEAGAMLAALSGRSHLVHTGVAVRRGGIVDDVVETTTVRFRSLAEAEIGWYVASGEGLDKAGGYAIQGRAGAFVASVEGCPTNVVGLPLAATVGLLVAVGWPWPPG